MALLSDEDIESYHTRGFFVLRDFFKKEVLDTLAPRSSPPSDTSPLFKKCVIYGNEKSGEDPHRITKLEGIGRLDRTDESSTKLIQLFDIIGKDVRLSKIASQLLGSRAALMKDKYIYKARGGGDGFPPHQDANFIYSRMVTDAVNFGVAFDDADASNGALEVCVEPSAYAHLFGRCARLPEQWTKYEETSHLKHEHVETRAGDVIVFSQWLLHRSSTNLTEDRDRNVYYITYGNPGYVKGVHGASGNLYEDYYELFDAWIESNYTGNDTASGLLGPDKPRPCLIPTHRLGVGWPRKE